MDIPKLFAQYAADNVDVWGLIVNKKIEHKIWGTGKIEEVNKNGESVIIHCSFNCGQQNQFNKKFIPKSFEGNAMIML